MLCLTVTDKNKFQMAHLLGSLYVDAVINTSQLDGKAFYVSD